MPIDHESLSRNLKLESAALGAFLALLRDEQQTLVRGDSERLALFAESKANRVFELTRLGNWRQELLRKHGYAADSAGMERLLNEHRGWVARFESEVAAIPAELSRAQQARLVKRLEHPGPVFRLLDGSDVNGYVWKLVRPSYEPYRTEAADL